MSSIIESAEKAFAYLLFFIVTTSLTFWLCWTGEQITEENDQIKLSM